MTDQTRSKSTPARPPRRPRRPWTRIGRDKVSYFFLPLAREEVAVHVDRARPHPQPLPGCTLPHFAQVRAAALA